MGAGFSFYAVFSVIQIFSLILFVKFVPTLLDKNNVFLELYLLIGIVMLIQVSFIISTSKRLGLEIDRLQRDNYDIIMFLKEHFKEDK